METVVARRRIATTVLPWALCGLSVGVAAGFLLSELLGAGGHRRIPRLLRRWKSPEAGRPRGTMIARVAEALAAEPSLGKQPIEVRSRGARGLELRGWVSSRPDRTLAHRIARAAAGDLEIANRLLVRGEDDRFELPAHEDVSRPA